MRLYARGMTATSHIRPATDTDVPAILGLIRELATYEREPDAVVATEQSLTAALFGDDPKVWASIVEHDGEPAGFVLWFLNFSTWEGRHGVYIEDLYVREEHRGRGYGTALMQTLAALCLERGYARLEWAVLDWNTPAIGFYERIGARQMTDWTVCRLDGDALAALGS
ncbi:MAG: family acetyltransferase [Frankiales bacterium]|nr:family acetyltransferase [Frankiales bacterium]